MGAIKYTNRYKKENDVYMLQLNNSVDWIIFDKEDLLKMKTHTWAIYSTKSYSYIITNMRYTDSKGKYKYYKMLLSRYLLDAPTKKLVKTINGNRLDMRKSNLRVV